MRFLVTYTPDITQNNGGWAKNGLPAIPALPTMGSNIFISIADGAPSVFTTIAELDTTVEQMIGQLVAYYPDLPRALLAAFVERTQAAAEHYATAGYNDIVLKLFNDHEKAELQRVGAELYSERFLLWERLPTFDGTR